MLFLLYLPVYFLVGLFLLIFSPFFRAILKMAKACKLDSCEAGRVTFVNMFAFIHEIAFKRSVFSRMSIDDLEKRVAYFFNFESGSLENKEDFMRRVHLKMYLHNTKKNKTDEGDFMIDKLTTEIAIANNKEIEKVLPMKVVKNAGGFWWA